MCLWVLCVHLSEHLSCPRGTVQLVQYRRSAASSGGETRPVDSFNILSTVILRHTAGFLPCPDFAEKASLHPDLARELTDADGSIEYFPNSALFIGSVADEVGAPDLGQVADAPNLSRAIRNTLIDRLSGTESKELTADFIREADLTVAYRRRPVE